MSEGTRYPSAMQTLVEEVRRLETALLAAEKRAEEAEGELLGTLRYLVAERQVRGAQTHATSRRIVELEAALAPAEPGETI